MKHGICKLCRRESDICNSHLLPKAIFPIIQNGDATGRISVVSDNISRFPRGNGAVSRPMLCHECEEKFSRYEKKVVSYCLGNEKHKLLARHLKQQEGVFVGKGIDGIFYLPEGYLSIWCAHDFYYFALSILWRNSVMKWGDSSVDHYYHALGELYERRIQDFLLTDDKISVDNVYLICAFNNGILNAPVAYFPSYQRIDGTYRNHEFAIPGIRFMVIIGKKLSPVLETMFATSNVALVGCNLQGTEHEKMLLRQMGTATETKKVKEEHQKWRNNQIRLLSLHKEGGE